ncbi:hypothetical protein [Paenibacillus macerans]|uniref:hypothetical protein n=1 Tax=Paenibacillus macerans TaxID=44252 RepID=UPI00203B20E6|nr:hypothetical protein [Paenibacillus macerans]MCM3703817.1 hypothetical protein [Paenibacillus macerans]
MDNNTVTKLLKRYRSYKFAVMNLGLEIDDLINKNMMRPIYAERVPLFISRYDKTFDRERYSRIVTMIESAVDFVLDDDQRTIIMRKYMDRNTSTLSEIATLLHKDRTTVGRWHKEAINELAIALLPISEEYAEITTFDHMFDPDWTFKEPA